MTSIIKMMLSVLTMVLNIAWRIIKFVCGPMWDSIKSLCKASWELYKAKKAQKAASDGDAAESISQPIEGTGEPSASQDTGDSESSHSNAQS